MIPVCPEKEENMPYDGPVNDNVLGFDPLNEAERITGEDYHKSKETSALGYFLLQAHSEDKRNRLRESCDTYYGQGVNEYLDVVKNLGFLPGVEENFTHESKSERYFIFWHPRDGILLSFDTWNGDHVNGGSFYYNWKPLKDFHPWISSGTADEVDGASIWYGNHDCREALRYHIVGLREHGSFVSPWKFRPLIHLGHYGLKPSIRESGMKTYVETSRELTIRYLAMLPSDAQAIFAATENWTNRGGETDV